MNPAAQQASFILRDANGHSAGDASPAMARHSNMKVGTQQRFGQPTITGTNLERWQAGDFTTRLAQEVRVLMVVFGVASYGVAIDSTHATNHGREAGLTKLDQIAVDSRLIPVAIT